MIKTDIDKIRPLNVQQVIKVNGYDIDVIGIVNNIVYVRWFEDLRMLFLDHYWPFQDMIQHGLSPILSRTNVHYIKPITIQDNPVGELWMSEINKARWTVKIEIRCADSVCCEGSQIGYFFDLDKKRVTRIPERFIEQFNKAVEDDGKKE